MLASAGISVGLGIWGCQYRELQPVFFGGGRILGAGSSSSGRGQVEEGDDVEMQKLEPQD